MTNSTTPKLPPRITNKEEAINFWKECAEDAMKKMHAIYGACCEGHVERRGDLIFLVWNDGSEDVYQTDLEFTRIHQKDPSHFAQRNQDKCKAGFDSSKVERGSTGPDTPEEKELFEAWANDHRYRGDAEAYAFSAWRAGRLVAASVQGETLSDRINALPEWVRQHIHDIETKCDPAGDIRTIGELRDNVAALEAEIAELRKGGK